MKLCARDGSPVWNSIEYRRYLRGFSNSQINTYNTVTIFLLLVCEAHYYHVSNCRGDDNCSGTREHVQVTNLTFWKTLFNAKTSCVMIIWEVPPNLSHRTNYSEDPTGASYNTIFSVLDFMYEVCLKNTRTVWIARLELVSGESAWCR